MPKLTPLTTLTSGFASTQAINENFTRLAEAVENTLSLDGSSPNSLSADLDVNNNRIINLADPTEDHEPVTYGLVRDLVEGIDDVQAIVDQAALDLGEIVDSATTDLTDTVSTATADLTNLVDTATTDLTAIVNSATADLDAAVVDGVAEVAAAAATDSELIATLLVDELGNGDFVLSDPDFRSDADIVNTSSVAPELAAKGLLRAVEWPLTNQYLRHNIGVDPSGSYFCGAFYVQSDSADFPLTSTIQLYQAAAQDSASGTWTIAGSPVRGYIELSPTLRLYWITGQLTTADTWVMLGSTSAASGSDRYASGYMLFLGDSAVSYQLATAQILRGDVARTPARRASERVVTDALVAAGVAPNKQGRLSLAGVGQVESTLSTSNTNGQEVVSTFYIWPGDGTDPTVAQEFDLYTTSVDDVLHQDSFDRMAPAHVFSNYAVGGGHSYTGGACTATHDKTSVDNGSLWQHSGGNQVRLVSSTSGVVYLWDTDANTAPATGTYSHVSGATHTSDIVVSAVTSQQIYPPFQDYSINLYVDGSKIDQTTGDLQFAKDVCFAETRSFLSRTTVTDWLAAQSGTGYTTFAPTGTPDFVTTELHRFNVRGDYTDTYNINVRTSTSVNDFMCIQETKLEGTGDIIYHIPHTVPFTYTDASAPIDYDFANGSVIDVSTWTDRLDLDSSRWDGDYVPDYMLMESDADGTGWACGFLPIGSASPTERAANVTEKALQINNVAVAKVYWRGFDLGGSTVAANTEFNFVCFRQPVVVRPSDGNHLARWVVETQSDYFVYVMYNDFDGMDFVSLPPECANLPFSVERISSNLTLRSEEIGSHLLVDALTAGTNGQLILRIKKAPVESTTTTYEDFPVFSYPSASYITNGTLTAANLSNTAFTANTMYVMPFHAYAALTIDQVALSVSSAVAGSKAKVYIYSSNPTTGQIEDLEATSAEIDTASTGARTGTLSYTFERGVTYYIGVWFSEAVTVAAQVPSSMLTWPGYTSVSATTRKACSRALTYGSASVPDPWTFSAAELVGSNVPGVFFRIA